MAGPSGAAGSRALEWAGIPRQAQRTTDQRIRADIGVVDIFDALVTPRPYRRRFFPHEAVRELIVAERMAFPREVIKALVEQLSAYPLGTLVRVTTGEVGTVVHVNAEFPLRPVVSIVRGADPEDEQEERRLDLSRMPLVSVIQTLESPDVSRVALSTSPPAERRTPFGPSVSDQFSSLLDNLDAIASAMQGVVQSRTAQPTGVRQESTQSEAPCSSGRSSAQDFADTSFEKEVIGLFALEAQEWLAQIHSALRQLGEGVSSSIRPKLCGIILHGLTNLAKSAATVHLQAIESMASHEGFHGQR